jgi:hypothetical protein
MEQIERAIEKSDEALSLPTEMPWVPRVIRFAAGDIGQGK